MNFFFILLRDEEGGGQRLWDMSPQKFVLLIDALPKELGCTNLLFKISVFFATTITRNMSKHLIKYDTAVIPTIPPTPGRGAVLGQPAVPLLQTLNSPPGTKGYSPTSLQYSGAGSSTGAASSTTTLILIFGGKVYYVS